MNLDEYKSLSDAIDIGELQRVFDIFFSELGKDEITTTYEKLYLLCDLQWHTYGLPSKDIQDKLSSWLISNWTDDDNFYELVLSACYCFGLSKELFQRALRQYNGDQKWEYELYLSGSSGENIDPYVSL